MGKSKYSKEQIECLKKYYPVGNYSEIYKLFPDKTLKQIQGLARCFKLKLDDPRRDCRITYTEEQINALEKYYPIGEDEKLFKLFPDKNIRQIGEIARKFGVIRTQRKKPNRIPTYTEEQIEILKKYYPTGDYEHIQPYFPQKTIRQIQNIAKDHSIKSENPRGKKNIVGQSAVMNCGMSCTVIEDLGYKNLTILFEDGTKVEHIQRKSFQNKTVSNPNLGRNHSKSYRTSILGQKKMMKCGMNCTVIEDNNSNDITVKFDDGTLREHCTRQGFVRGTLSHPNLGRGYTYIKDNSIVGEKKVMHCGMECTVIEDNGSQIFI